MSETTVVAPSLQSIPVDKIKPAAHQARKTFDEESIKALAESIRQEGLLQPILVRPVAEGYELISGERRLRATKLLASPTIEAKVIQPISEAETAAKGLVENLQREDLNPVEEAEGFDALNKLDPNYWTLEQIGQVSGRDKGYVSRSVSLLNLPDEIKEKLRRRNFSRSHGVELTRLPSHELQLEAAKLMESGLKRDEARKLVDKMLKPEGKEGGNGDKKAIPDPLQPLWQKLETDRFKLGCWSVSYPKEDQWVFHFKPTRERPLAALADLLDSLSLKLNQYNLDQENAKP